MSESSAFARYIPQTSLVLATCVAVYAIAAVCVGWLMGIELLVRHPLTKAAMVPATAVTFALAAGAVVSLRYGARMASLILCCLVILISAVMVLAQSIGWANVGSLFLVETAAQDRMALSTAILFLLCAFGILQLLAERLNAVSAIGIFGLSASFCAGVWTIADMDMLSGLRICDGMSLQTAALFGLLFLSMCLITQDDDFQLSDQDGHLT